jgi:hypothetical protein
MADFPRSDQVSVIIRPAGGDDHSLSAADFIKQVDALRQLLALAEARGADARIVHLHMNSPATVVMETIGANEAPVDVSNFMAGLEAIAVGGEAPREFSRPVFDAFREFAAVVGKGVRSATIESQGRTIVIDLEARKRIESVFGQDISSGGSVDGMLEAINVHGQRNTFALYPIVGASRITCKFDDQLLAKVRPALGRYVVIEGELKYRWREKFPYEAKAHKIEILDDWDAQPSFVEMVGSAPEATGGLPSEEFTRKVRHGW